jgi:uncharacterized membrane protein YidH (DUF202 family)
MDKSKAIFQAIWGVLLLLMGVLLFFQVPQVMERIAQIEYYASIKWIIRIIVYVIAVILIGGGGKKIFENYKHLTKWD